MALALCVSILVHHRVRALHPGRLGDGAADLASSWCSATRIHRHYRRSKEGLRQLDDILETLPQTGEAKPRSLDPKAPTAVLLVSAFSGFGVHTLLSILRYFPGLYKQFIFVSVAVVDSGTFKGKEEIEALQRHTEEDLDKYVEVARRLGFAADCALERGDRGRLRGRRALCQQVAKLYPKATIFTGKLVFRRERFFYGLLHNETSKIIQRRLQWVGVPMVVLPIRARV